MADRGAVPEKQKFERWQRTVEDRLGTLERRKVQGDLAMDTLHMNQAIDFPPINEYIDGPTLLAGSYPTLIQSSATLNFTGASATTTIQVPSASFVPSRTGIYTAHCAWDVLFNAGVNATFVGSLTVTKGALFATQGLFLDAAAGPIARATVYSHGIWRVDDAAGARLNMVANLNANPGATIVQLVAGSTSMMVYRMAGVS